MKIILLIILSFLFTGSSPIQSGCLQMDIMLLGDFSDSVIGYESFVANGFSSFIKKFELSETGVKIGVITFASIAEVYCPLTSDSILLRTRVDSLHHLKADGATNMYLALSFAKNQFSINGRPHYKKMIIVVSDGEPYYSYHVEQFAEKIKAENIGICSVLIVKNLTSDSPMNYLVMQISQTSGAEFMQSISSNCYVESNYENLITELRKLEICP